MTPGAAQRGGRRRPERTGREAREAARRPASARRVAIDALIAIDRGGRANVVVPDLLARSQLDERDRSLVSELAYGTCRMQRACDWLTGRYTHGALDEEVRAGLRVGAYQIGWTRIPAHAAVSATVEEIRGRGRTLVNAVLRRVAVDIDRGVVVWPDLATELSYPDWIVDRLVNELGVERAHQALRTMNEPPTVATRADGYIQDSASQMVAAHLHLFEPERVLDVCAAPGGKATGLVQSATELVAAADISPARAATMAGNVARLGATRVTTVVADGLAPPFRSGSFDLVLVDAPCSGLGVLRRRPDARWRIRPPDVDRLAGLQRKLLTAARPMVKPRGVLAYSVCTLTSAETAAVDNWLAREAPELVPLPPPGPPWRPAGRGALLLPQDAGTDGMFMLNLRAPERPA
jgi:16S rRNA (cytosine967-C5)-methyltransferase